MSFLFNRRKSLQFHIMETWLLVLEELEAIIVTILANSGLMAFLYSYCKPRYYQKHVCFEIVTRFTQLLGGDAGGQWVIPLCIACAKISLIVYVVSLVCAMACQFFYIIRFFYGLVGFFSKLMLFTLPVLFLAATMVGKYFPILTVREAYIVVFLPCLILFFKCFDDVRLIFPEIGHVIYLWFTAFRARWSVTSLARQRDAGNVGQDLQKYLQLTELDRKYGRVLGLEGDIGLGDIRKRYLQLTKEYHPDKVLHLGPKLREVAEAEMRKINEAYEYFRKKYGIWM